MIRCRRELQVMAGVALVAGDDRDALPRMTGQALRPDGLGIAGGRQGDPEAAAARALERTGLPYAA
jgi:hypothetical protein